MKNKDTVNIQQQVIFSESDTITEQADTQCNEVASDTSCTTQVIFDNDDYSPLVINVNSLDKEVQTEFTDEPLSQDVDIIQGSKPSWLWRVIVILFMALFTIEAFYFFIIGFEQSPITTSIYALLLAFLTLVAGNSLWREFMGLKHFKHRQKMKEQAVKLLLITPDVQNEGTNKQGRVFCANISDQLPCDLTFDSVKEQQLWQAAVSSEYSASELVQLYSRIVLSKVDEKALNEVAKFSTEAVVLVALSPVALIDMLIILSRNLRMINKIAGLYGLKLGYWSRIKLIKHIFVNMAYAGASELIADFGSDMLGAELLGKLSTRFAQGLGAGMLTARLGAKTMELCRPIPFHEKPKLTDVRKKIAQQIKSLMNI